MKPYSKIILFILFSIFLHGAVFGQSTDITIKDIQIVNQDDTLSGSIFIPKKYYAAVVLIHGSGQEKRMTDFATLLANEGIAVLTYDKRGVGRSGGIYAGPEVGTNNIDSANLHLLASDGSIAIDTLKKYINRTCFNVGLLGCSQAGFIIPLIAQKNKQVRFVVIFSGPLITARKQLRFQFYTNGNLNFWNEHTETEVRQHIFNDADKYNFVDTDPCKSLSQLNIFGLWIFGGKDIQVPVQLSIEHLNSLKKKNKHYEYLLFPSLGHNTAFSNSKQPMVAAIKWIQNLRFKN
ncbi:alpha/beta hydrolase family protein [Rhizosphaericola mali]|uniref:Alpha/beta hydrolase n=1 Tax=Rhizosphaericola mali TaxID=2545455 RepID=A0A5P2G5J5_9BACT|nr:alpha/beta hydrolase [Rhizosphaericola mali]QES89082.1 alpha/beta hydrolase [Rhizosphaericola mali]